MNILNINTLKYYLPLLLCFSLLAGCDDDDNDGQFMLDSSMINFMDPVVGQTNVYHGYTANCSFFTNILLDTMTLRVVAVTDSTLEINELSRDFRTNGISYRFNRIPGGLFFPEDLTMLSLFFDPFQGDTIPFQGTPTFPVEYDRCFFRSQGSVEQDFFYQNGALASVDKVGYNRDWFDLKALQKRGVRLPGTQSLFFDEQTIPFSLRTGSGFEENRFITYYELQLP